MRSFAVNLPDAEATQQLGRRLGKCLPIKSLLLLQGALGAGKTTLVQGIGEGLGIDDPILSPTFTLINEYTQGRLPLYHLDLYRLQPEEIEALYLDQYWEGETMSAGITVIEWAARLPYRPSDYLEIQLSYQNNQGRQAILTPVGNFSPNLPELWRDKS
ncbi:MAG: tRNA (adenosine(37)-N6)-threonylcarbamoyltransferase complex ATPase subunit type 1 TsaE [Cyanobacteria bacterium P01_G01_bin.49]